MPSKDEEALRTLSEFTKQLEFKEKYQAKNRFSLLIVHALLAILVGSNILKYGPPQTFMGLNIADRNGLILGLMPFVGGLFLFLGLVMRRLLMLEGIGMTCILIWDAWMMIGFWVAFEHELTPNPYPIYIYSGLLAFMVIHLITFYKFIGGVIDGKY